MSLAKFNPCQPCCNPAGVAVVTCEQYGDGYIICIADSNILDNTDCPGKSMLESNLGLLHNIYQLSNSGIFGWSSNVFNVWNNILLNSVKPTVNSVDTVGELSSIDVLWLGHTPKSCDSYYVPEPMYQDVVDWVYGGGIMILVGEWGGCAGLSTGKNNAILSLTTSSTRFNSDVISSGICSSKPINTSNILSNNLYSLTEIWIIASTTITANNNNIVC